MKAKSAKGEFEKFRETWSRQVLADKELDHRAARVASFLVWLLNRETRTAFPSLSTIAARVGIDRADASKDIDELVARGHLKKRKHPRTRKNEYIPMLVNLQQVVGESPTSVGESPTPMLESPESLSGNLKGLSGVTSDIEPLIQPPNITSDIAGSLATALPTGALARPKQSEEKEEFENEGKQARSDFPSNSKPAQPSSPHPPNSARPPSPQAKPGEELAAALERLGNGVRANGGNLTVGSSDVTRAMHWQ